MIVMMTTMMMMMKMVLEVCNLLLLLKIYEPLCVKTGFWGFRPGLTQTSLYVFRSRLEA